MPWNTPVDVSMPATTRTAVTLANVGVQPIRIRRNYTAASFSPRRIGIAAFRLTAQGSSFVEPRLIWILGQNWTILPASVFAGNPETNAGIFLWQPPREAFDILPMPLQVSTWTP